ncbi:MAG TPA: CHC2 zinc finger domain-containing protein [Thermoanaerobaculia bacterium]|nr:CHC2 zinc finger domain-containing protein [Thermoanaerobaculia bacterium]
MKKERQEDRVRRLVDLVALVGETVPIVRCGSRLIGPCPFCQEEDDSESLEVFAAEGMFGCSNCGREGDCFKWRMMFDGLTFAEALEACAAGVSSYRKVA